jgi:hypothetical protein
LAEQGQIGTEALYISGGLSQAIEAQYEKIPFAIPDPA